MVKVIKIFMQAISTGCNCIDLCDKFMIDSKEKIPDHLVDFCKCSSVNQMAAGSRSSHGIFLLSTNFSNTPQLTNIFILEEAVGPGVLQTFKQ